ncbi:MAG: hypothetical protein RI894_732 [Bacteroidota bacterium]|jgi:hypothetical protein
MIVGVNDRTNSGFRERIPAYSGKGTAKLGNKPNIITQNTAKMVRRACFIE